MAVTGMTVEQIAESSRLGRAEESVYRPAPGADSWWTVVRAMASGDDAPEAA